jgi:hypothetical protein
MMCFAMPSQCEQACFIVEQRSGDWMPLKSSK